MAYIDSVKKFGELLDIHDKTVDGKIDAAVDEMKDYVEEHVISEDKIEHAVTKWLDEHPEATTTIEDGAVSYAKLDEALHQRIEGMETDVSSLKTDLAALEADVDALETEVAALDAEKLDKPATAGTSGQILKTNGDGTTAWIDLPDGVTIDATLTKTGEAADAKAAGDKIDAKVSKPVNDPDGQDGQVLVSNGDGTTRWEDFSGGGKDIKNAIVTLDVNRFTYDGTAKKPTVTSVKADGVALVENRDYVVIADNATNAGEYYITVVGIGDYSGAAKKMFEVDKAAGHVSIDKTDVELNNEKLLDTITVIRPGDGAVTAASSDTEVATVSVSGDTVTITAGTKGGTATITISVAEGTNHTASNNVTCTVKHLSISPNLSEVTPDIIQSVAQAGTGESYWSVGDKTAPIAFNSVTVGALDMTGISLSAFIIGFNHNSEIEGEGIHFTIGKSENNIVAAFIDSKYGTSNPEPPGFIMSPGEGWEESYMRNTICNDFLLAMPSDWYNAIKHCTKHTRNYFSGNVSELEVTNDKIWLLSEFEITGDTTVTDTSNKDVQKQYQYFLNGNSAERRKFDGTFSTTANYFLRNNGLRFGNQLSVTFYNSIANGVGTFAGTTDIGFAPCFVVG